jgi:hypothetical protein
MAYLRYSPQCEWYVFGQTSGQLAVWHQGNRAGGPEFSRQSVQDMLTSGDLSGIPGYRPEHSEILVKAMREWLEDEQRGDHAI